MPDDFTITGRNTSRGEVSGYKGSEADQGSKYSDMEADAERQRYRKSKGFSGLGGAAKMKQSDRDDENAYMANWRKNKGQKDAVKASPSPSPSPTPDKD